jgi:hypothetical protein
MIKKTEGEKWRQVVFENCQTMQRKYAISNKGRLASYEKSVEKDGVLLKGSEIGSYKVLRLRVQGAFVAFLFHRMVAASFLKKPKKDETMVIHLNHKKEDNRVENLAWASKFAVAAHNKNSPAVMAYHKKLKDTIPDIKKGLKLTLGQVKQIKKSLNSPNRKLTHKQLALKYGVSGMTITRIKRGENWGHVKV